jgi:hypothetical protein
MRSIRISAGSVALVMAVSITGASAAAQAAVQDNARWLGPWLNVHYTYAGGTSMDADVGFNTLDYTSSGSSGGGFGFGYTFIPWLSVFGNADVAPSQTITSAQVTGSQTLYQLDAGVRAQLPFVTIPLMIYGELAVSSRILTGTAQVQGLSPAQGHAYDTWGGAVTYGVGAQYLVGRALAIDVSYLASSGTYEWIKMANISPIATHASSSSSSRVLAGITWFPGR